MAGRPLTRRWTEQRSLLDNIIRTVGMDWDQPRSIYLSSPMGSEGGQRRLRGVAASALTRLAEGARTLPLRGRRVR
jgi:hypothetical protein